MTFPMHEPEDTPGASNSQVNMTLATTEESYGVGEVVWGIFLLVGIVTINMSVLWVVSRSRELWKPRHLWMACLCVTDILVGAHKALELLTTVFPFTYLCVVKRATLGIPYVVNMLILSLLSMDRFTAVQFPFFYSANVSNQHVVIGFLIVLMVGGCLAAVSISVEMQQPDPICRMHYTMPSDMLVCLTIVLALCSILTLFFNLSVLRTAKQQLNAIYAQDPSLAKCRRRISLLCTGCGYKNETFVNTLLPISSSPTNGNMVTKSTSTLPQRNSSPQPTILPLSDPVVMGPLDLEINLKNYDDQLNGLGMGSANTNMHINCDSDDSTPLHLIDETITPLVRTVSLPAIQDTISLPIMVVQPDPSQPPAVVIGVTDVELACRKVSITTIDNNACKHHAPVTNESSVAASRIQSGSVVPGRHLLPRSRSLMTCKAHKIIPQPSAVPRLQLFRNLHFARTHMFHMGRLFPSIRFARTVLFIMIPMWVFILPIVIIIPMYRGCENAGSADLTCKILGYMWRYLFIHMRSILPLQAIIDTLLYAFGSKEFRLALNKLMKKIRQPKH